MKKGILGVMLANALMLFGCATDGNQNSIDFASVDSREKAQELYVSGELSKVYLFPLDLGGIEAEVNTVYIPKQSADEKQRIDLKVLELAVDGKIEHYEANPVYLGKSFIPSEIVIIAEGEENFTHTIKVYQ